MDDRTVGLVLRALRRRRGWRQADVAVRAGCSQALVSNVERGHLEGVTVATLRSLFSAVDGRLVLEPRWRGAAMDRLLDADHAAIANAVATRLQAAGWQVLIEVTYAIGADRGSIDVLGVHPAYRAALAAEIKSDVPSVEATGRKLDEKQRLASRIVRDRLGWTPAVVGAVLVLPDVTRLRNLLAGPGATLARMFPVDSRRVSRWLRQPIGPFAATWFVPNITLRNAPRQRRPISAQALAMRRPAAVHPSVQHDEDLPPVRVLR
jgi:transcriptional regulator with XRE-family HTH domain